MPANATNRSFSPKQVYKGDGKKLRPLERVSLLEPSSSPLQPAARAPSRTRLPPAGPPDQGQGSSSSSPQERFHLGWVGSSPSPTRGSGMRRANGCVVEQIRVRSFLLTLLPPWVRMVEKATLPGGGKDTERGSTSLGAQGQLSRVISSCFWEERKWGKPESESNEVIRASDGGTGD